MDEKEKVDQNVNEQIVSSENDSLQNDENTLLASSEANNSDQEQKDQSAEIDLESDLEASNTSAQVESEKVVDKKKKSHKKNRRQRKAKIDKDKSLDPTAAADAPEEVQQVLVSVSDEYLRKKRRKKIITLSSILSVVLILSIAIITLACVNVNLKPFFIEPPSSYTIVIDGSERATLTMTDDEYNNFTELFEKSMQVNALQALFTGRLGGYRINEGRPSTDSFYTSNTTKADLNSSLVSTLGSNYVRMRYSVEQNLFKSNGNYQYSSFDTTKKLCYIDIVFSLSTENQDSDVTLYFGTYAQSSSQDASAYITTITITANTYALYDYIVNG